MVTGSESSSLCPRLQEVNEHDVSLQAVPPQLVDLLIIEMAQTGRQLLGQVEEVAVIPLTTFSEQLSKWSWILCPIVFADGCLRKEPTIKVETENVIEHVHALKQGRSPQDVAFWMSSINFVGGPAIALNKAGKLDTM